MGNRRNVIMLNGNRYDASTGQLLDGANTTTPQKPKAAVSNIDGFVKSASPKSPARHQHHVTRSTLKSKTLMRSAVNRPKTSSKTATANTPITKTSSQVDQMRISRSQQVNRSKLISKFGNEVKKITKYSPLPIAKPPSEQHSLEHTDTHNIRPEVSVNPKVYTNKFEDAMRNSTSHTNPKASKLGRRHRLARKLRISPSLLNISLLVITAVLLGGYFAYNNVPNLAMRVASARSGISGSMPGYQPSGFAMSGPIQYKPGQILVSYKSNSDERTYTVAQRNSDWNSETLLENHVAVDKRPYQTFQDKGKTVYIYDGDSASWVDNGVWYELDGNSSLNTDQVLRIANSL